MNTRTIFNALWLSGFAMIICGAIYGYYNKGVGSAIIYAGMGLTVIAIIIRLRFLKKR
jgi:hypothetical protein